MYAFELQYVVAGIHGTLAFPQTLIARISLQSYAAARKSYGRGGDGACGSFQVMQVALHTEPLFRLDCGYSVFTDARFRLYPWRGHPTYLHRDVTAVQHPT